jgi:Icc-related predicted phosphoesterase
MKMYKILALSDTHGLHEKVTTSPCDLLIHSGDFTGRGTMQETLNFAKWLYTRPAKRKVVVAGNHDSYAESNYDVTKTIFSEHGVTYLENQVTVIEGLKIFGSPCSPEFCNWHFMHPRDKMYSKVWSKVPTDTDIIICHTPPYGLRDYIDETRRRHSNEDIHVGCKGLRQRLDELTNLKYVFCGHIHNGYGIETIKGSLNGKVPRIKVVNSSTCGEDYYPSNKPIEITL